ncbi:MAG: ribonuclease J [Clostridiales bacterium]|nr:ribonuclease J [Clostridiales bacterium]
MAKKYNPLSIVFLGGVGEIGKNLTAIKYGEEILIVDCGSSFPTQDTPGVDLIVPDFSYLEENKDKIVGLVITHGHEDHIGGIPFLLAKIPNIPIYGSNLAIALIEHKLKEKKVNTAELNVVEAEDKIQLGSFTVEFIQVAHSIIGAFALAITTPRGLIFHTGDFKIDYTPIGNSKPVDISSFARIGNRGVLLMLGESTNVEKPGTTISEKHVGKTLDKIFMANPDKRIIIATFASNVNRVQQIISIAEKSGRKVAFSGRSMIKICEMALDMGLITMDRENLVEVEHIKDYPPEKTCIISTGSQGEPMSALTRMANGVDKIKVQDGDLIVISSSAIPGNEKAIYTVINNLYRQGAKVMYGSLEELHVSGHACREELKMMLSLIRPKFFIPVHGEYRHLKQHAKLAQDLGIPKEHIEIAEIGDVIEIKTKKMQHNDKVKAGALYVDGLGQISHELVKERRQLSNEGLIVVVCKVNKTHKILSDDYIIDTRGVDLRDEDMEEIKICMQKSFVQVDVANKPFDKTQFEQIASKKVANRIAKLTTQKPLVVPVVVFEDEIKDMYE